MDLETENRIAAILMKEAAELRRQAAREGIDAYLHPPNVRGRPNSRFLTATVLGVQQANKAVEVNEMWKARQKEKELDNRGKKVTNYERNRSGRYEDYERKHSSLCSSSKSEIEDGLQDKDIEEFLNSRAKRGRGAVGSRMDETGPYLPETKGKDLINNNNDDERWENRAVFGPEKPRNLRAKSSSDDEDCFERREKRVKREGSKKHRSKDKGKEKKKKKREREREKKRNKNY